MSESNVIEKVESNFTIDITTVSPLLQIEPSGKKDIETKASIVATKKTAYINERGTVSYEPFFSGNGFRGVLRRNIATSIFDALNNKYGKARSVDTLHLYSAGGGTARNGFVNVFDSKLPYKDMNDFREANPFLSLFGAGLSDIDGKLSVTSISPSDRKNKLTDYIFGVRFDDTERTSVLSPFIDTSSIEEYQEDMIKKKNSNSDIRKLDDTIKKLNAEVEKESSEDLLKKLEDAQKAYDDKIDSKSLIFQQTYKAEYVIPNTQLHASIGTRAGYELSEVEEGMMLYGLIETSKQNIGSYGRIGWGAMNYKVKTGSGAVLFTTICDPDYILNRTVEVTPLGQKKLAIYKEWLKNIKEEDILLP